MQANDDECISVAVKETLKKPLFLKKSAWRPRISLAHFLRVGLFQTILNASTGAASVAINPSLK
jgi:hypothetical protein